MGQQLIQQHQHQPHQHPEEYQQQQHPQNDGISTFNFPKSLTTLTNILTPLASISKSTSAILFPNHSTSPIIANRNTNLNTNTNTNTAAASNFIFPILPIPSSNSNPSKSKSKIKTTCPTKTTQKKTKTSTSKVKTPPKTTPGPKPKPKMKKITKKKKAVVVSLDNNKAILEPTVGNSKLYTTPNKLNSNMNMNTTTTTANTTPYTTAPPNINYTTAPPPPPPTTITNNTPPQPTTTTPTRTRKPWDKPLCPSVAAINSRRRRARCKRKKEMIENALYHFQKKPSDFAFSEQKLELLDTPSLRKGNIATKGEISK